MAIVLKDQEVKVRDNLTAIFKSESLKPTLKNANFQTILEKQLNILNYLEKTNETKPKSVDGLLKQYLELSGKKLELDDKLSYKDNDELVDDINYLSIYIRNIYKIDLEALVAGKEQTAIIAPTVSDAPIQNNNMTDMAAMMQGMMGAMGGVGGNPMYEAMASAKLHQDAIQGKVYLYKSKPKIMIYVKWALAIGMLLFAVFCALLGAGIIASQKPNAFNAIMYFVLAFIFFFSGYRNLKPLLGAGPAANENAKYSFQWKVFLFNGIFVVLILAIGAIPITNGSETASDYSCFGMYGPWTEPGNAGLLLWFIGMIGTLASLLICIAAVVVGSIYAPKLDNDKIRSLIQQYIVEMQKQTPPVPPTTVPPPPTPKS